MATSSSSGMTVSFKGGAVKISQAQFDAFMREPDGPVAKKFSSWGAKVKEATVAKLKTGFPQDYLAPKIRTRLVMASNGPHVTVGASDIKTRPHPIVGNPVLVFHWKKAGRVVAFRRVHHPGSDMAPYLIKKLNETIADLRGELNA